MSSPADQFPETLADPRRPLAGIRVLDLSRALAGPLCTTILADLGADVVKVESLPAGDMTRDWGPLQDGHSLYFASVNRNKRSVALDLHTPPGRKALHRLAAHSHLVVENFRPGVMDALGLGERERERDYPGLAVLTISGFGPTGPLADRGAVDQIIQGFSGLMSLTGERGAPGVRVGIPIADILTGMFAAIGALARLPRPAKLPGGGTVHVSLLESVLGVLTFQAQRYLSLGEVASPEGNDHPVIVPYGTFEAADGLLNIAVGGGATWDRFCTVLGVPELATDPRFATNAARREHRDQLLPLLNEVTRRRTRAVWTELLVDAGVPCGPVHDVGEALDHEQVAALGLIDAVEHGGLGPLRSVGSTLWLDGATPATYRSAPLLGEHTIEVLTSLGIEHADLMAMLDEGIAVDGAPAR